MNRRYANLLFTLSKDKNIHQLSREVNMTTSHLSNITDQWQREGLLTKERKGRETEIHITAKGKEVMKLVQKFDDLYKDKKPEREKENENEGKNNKVSQN
jgi:predicted transcriptional regulator